MAQELSPNLKKEIETAVARLRDGDVIGLPTETVYGLAGDISQARALELIFKTKARPFFDPLIVHIATHEQVRELVSEKDLTASVAATADVLMKAFWPGPLTLVLPKKPSVNSLITSGLDTVGIRMPAHPVALEIIRRLGRSVAAPSANMFGKTSPTTAEHVRTEFGEKVFVVDGGECEVGLESTVVGFEPAGVVIYRPGQISRADIVEQLKAAFEEKKLSTLLDVRLKESPVAPGHLEHHYMPNIPVVILDCRTAGGTHVYNEDLPAQLAKNWQEEIAAQLPVESQQIIKAGPAAELNLGLEPATAARRLYSELRRLAESGASFIYVVRTLENSQEEWAAIWNRLEKAASITVHSRDFSTSLLNPAKY